MAVKNLTSLVNSEPTRQLTLPNLDGVSHAAGTRGVLCRSLYRSDGKWGVVPVFNTGFDLMQTNANVLAHWQQIPQSAINDTNIQTASAATCVHAASGDILVAAWISPQNFIASAPSNEDMYVFAFDGDTGLLKSTQQLSGTALTIGAGSANTDVENVFEAVEDDFFVGVVKDRPSAGYWTIYGVNYDGTNLSDPSNCTKWLTGGATAHTTFGASSSMNNAGSELVVLQSDFDSPDTRAEFFTVAITGNAGARILDGTSVLAEQVDIENQWDFLHMRQGGKHNLFRLSNDSIIFFGHMKAGSTGSATYNATNEYWINILDTSAVAITQNYYLGGVAPTTGAADKYAYHACVAAFETGTADEYIVLTKNSNRTVGQNGPADYWSDENGYDHIRAHKITIDPADNSITDVNLGEFHGSFFRGCMLDKSVAGETRDQSEVYDWAFDATNEYIMFFTKSYATKLQFTSGLAATDNDNSMITPFFTSPFKTSDTEHILSTNVWSAVNQDDINQKTEGWMMPGHLITYDHTRKALWIPAHLSWARVSNDNPGLEVLRKIDTEQNMASSMECVYADNGTGDVKVLMSVDVFANDGVPVGTSVGGITAITDEQVIAGTPTGTILELLADGNVFVDESDEDWLYQWGNSTGFTGNPAGNSQVLTLNMGFVSGMLEWPDNLWEGIQGLTLHSGSTPYTTYPGPLFAWDDLDTDLWVWYHGWDTSSRMAFNISSEGHWVYGAMGPLESSAGAVFRKYGYRLKPSSRIEINGTVEDDARLLWKKFDDVQEIPRI